MDGYLEATFNMFRAAKKVGDDFVVFVNTVPALQAGFLKLTNFINTITGLISLQAQVITGNAVSKRELKERMATLTFNYSGPGRAWAAENNNNALFDALNVSISKIKAALDDQAGPMCQTIYGHLNTNALTLVPYGLSAAMLSELLNTINDYMASVPLPTNAINNRQTYTQNIEDKIKETSEFLERQLDNLVVGQTNNNADFARTYKNSREILNPPTHSTTFKFIVLDENGDPINNAKCEAINTTKVSFTGSDGKAELVKFLKGKYNLLVSHSLYVPEQRDNVEIGLGETLEVTFKLIKAVQPS